MTHLVIWMLVVMAPHTEPKVMAGFTSEEKCAQAVKDLTEPMKTLDGIAICSAYVPRDQT
jgi:hypothetical protein